MFSNRSFFTKLILVLALLAVSSLAVVVEAMPPATASEDEVVAQLVAEARTFGLAIDPAAVIVDSTTDGTTATAILTEPWREEEIEKGVDIAFGYVSISKPQAIPNGYYKLHLQGDSTTRTLTFLDKDNKPVVVAREAVTAAEAGILGRTIWMISVSLTNGFFWSEFDHESSRKPVLRWVDTLMKATPTPHHPPLGQ